MDQEFQQPVSRRTGRSLTPAARTALIMAGVALVLVLLFAVGPLLVRLVALACRGI